MNYELRIKNKKREITLLIDTSSNKEIAVGLEIDRKKYILKRKINVQKAQAALLMIEKILSKHNLKLKDLNEIKINTGPGSFTGLRVGVSVANALSFALKIPVNGKAAGEFVEAVYE